jgi:hypothetical protein
VTRTLLIQRSTWAGDHAAVKMEQVFVPWLPIMDVGKNRETRRPLDQNVPHLPQRAVNMVAR